MGRNYIIVCSWAKVGMLERVFWLHRSSSYTMDVTKVTEHRVLYQILLYKVPPMTRRNKWTIEEKRATKIYIFYHFLSALEFKSSANLGWLHYWGRKKGLKGIRWLKQKTKNMTLIALQIWYGKKHGINC